MTTQVPKLELLYGIVRDLAAYDPVRPVTISPPVAGTPKGLTKSFVRQCALCRAMSGHNEETLRHEASCPWIRARSVK